MNKAKTFILAVCFALTALPVLAGPVADTEFTSVGLSWQPQIAFSSATLVISGPRGELYEQSFRGGVTPSWSLFDGNGFQWADGTYTYELRLTPAGGSLSRPEGADRLPVTDGKGDFAQTVHYGYFTIADGALADPSLPTSEDKGLQVAPKDQVFVDDLIVDGSLCVGMDCANGESFGFETVRLKENNLRLRFFDTSNSASFPSNDWQITANDTSNGGANKYSIDDIDGGRTPFTIEAGAPSNSLYVDDGGRIGFGTATPVVDLHVKSGNTPTLRLEQDGSSGFNPQTWDVAGNEANFFIRDATNGSTLPIQIKPGAPTASVFIAADGDVGVGTASPDADMHILYTDSGDGLHIETTATGATTNLLSLESASRPRLEMINGSVGNNGIWNFDVLNTTGNFAFTNFGTSNVFTFETSGNLRILGDFFSNTCTTGNPCAPDFVFEEDYPLMPLDEVKSFIAENKHLPNVPSADELSGSINISKMQMTLLEKVEELTLYTLQQEETIAELKARLEALEGTEQTEQ